MPTSDIVILGLAIILLGIAGGLSIKSYYDLGANPKAATDESLSRARSYMFWSAIISFIGLFLVIGALIMMFVFGGKTSFGTQKWIMIGLVGITFVLILIAGILCALGASKMGSASAFTNKGSDYTAYATAIGSAVILLLGVTVLFLVYLGILIMRKPDLVALAKDQAKKIEKAVSPYLPFTSSTKVDAGQTPLLGKI